MPFRTEGGSHYHETYGCHGATIPCTTEGLEPCMSCCTHSRVGSFPADSAFADARKAAAYAGSTTAPFQGVYDDDPDDAPAYYRGEVLDIRSDDAFAVRIMPKESGDLVTSKGEVIGRATGGKSAEARASRLDALLEACSPYSSPLAPRSMPSLDLSQADYERSIYFDMDGTVADLYAVDGWLERLRSHDASPYEEAQPLVDMDELRDYITDLQESGWRVGVVSWLSKVPTPEYDREVAVAKRAWLGHHLPMLDEINFVSYGVPKHQAVSAAHDAVLVDDEPHNLEAWCDDEKRRTGISAQDPDAMMAALGWLADTVREYREA